MLHVCLKYASSTFQVCLKYGSPQMLQVFFASSNSLFVVDQVVDPLVVQIWEKRRIIVDFKVAGLIFIVQYCYKWINSPGAGA